MKQCPYCNAQIEDDSLFCTECGKPVYNEKKGRGLGRYIAYAIAGVILLALIGLWANKSGNHDSPSTAGEIEAGQSSDSSEKSGKDYTEEDIELAVKDMYKDILGDLDFRERDKKYTSSEYQSLYENADKLCEDEVGILCYDHWIQSQDCDSPSLKSVSVKKESDDKAIADVQIKLFKDDDYTNKFKIVLLYENGKWVVDDFISKVSDDTMKNYSEKEFFKEYIEEAQSRPKDDRIDYGDGNWMYKN